MAELATKKIGAESGLVPRLTGWWLRPSVCGKLDAVLQNSSRGVGSDIPAVKTYQNGSATKPQAYIPEYVYGNGNINGNGFH
ncbi:hypothetical protein MTR_7g069680 [Medicago truncatula]|uniref:Uncharacterized protein n=1 Tax=Medicago truncatula TaxID=3880 RepID=G7KSD0_MEDTR|nr:hypothetical protein MTR_7g069680 [Medicago truncatula]